MIRYTLLSLAILATAAAAATGPHHATVNGAPVHQTVIYKNQAFPVLGPVAVEPCATEDCSDVPG
jgi:hypothetical protein